MRTAETVRKTAINTHYEETSNEIIVTVLDGRKTMSRTITEKRTGLTIIEVYKEGNKKPIERYVFNR